jgi:uncharacterized protein
VAIRLSPRASADRLVGIGGAAAGGRMLKATVTAPADGGRANEALLLVLARAWHLPRRDLSIIQGTTSRNKVVHIAGDSRQLIEKITARLSGLPGW